MIKFYKNIIPIVIGLLLFAGVAKGAEMVGGGGGQQITSLWQHLTSTSIKPIPPYTTLGGTGANRLNYVWTENLDAVNATLGTTTVGGASTGSINMQGYPILNLGYMTGSSTQGNIYLNGGDLYTSATTVRLYNGTTTTLNIGGASTATNIGASTGTTTLGNDLKINGGNLLTNATTFNLFSGTTTTLNVGDVAATISLANGFFTLGSSTQLASIVGTTTISGNVGIGTTTPAAPLHVVGNTYVTGTSTVLGDLMVVGGNLMSNASTVNLFVGTSTGVNIGNVATSISLANGFLTLGSSTKLLTITGSTTTSGMITSAFNNASATTDHLILSSPGVDGYTGISFKPNSGAEIASILADYTGVVNYDVVTADVVAKHRFSTNGTVQMILRPSAVLQLGIEDGQGSTVSAQIRGTSALADTNKAGNTLTITPAQGSGNADQGTLLLQGFTGKKVSGTTQHTGATLLTVGNTGGTIDDSVGKWLNQGSLTFNDAVTAAAGTVASFVFNSFAVPTLTATNAVNYTEVTTFTIAGAPTCSTNATCANTYAFWVKAGEVRLDGVLDMAGGQQVSTKTVTLAAASYTVLNTDYVLDITTGDATGTNDINLPAVATAGKQTIVVINGSAQAAVLDGDGAELIRNGTVSAGTSSVPSGSTYTLVSDGTKWIAY